MITDQIGVVTIILKTSSMFPPAYGDNPFVFSLALGSMLYVSLMAIATSIRMGCTIVGARRHGLRWGHALMLHRIFVIGLLLTLILGRLPDAITILLWGEPTVSPEFMTRFMLADRVLDGLAVVPFCVGILCLWFSSKGSTVTMMAEAAAVDIRATWPTLRVPIRLAGLVFLVTVLVTVGKWLST